MRGELCECIKYQKAFRIAHYIIIHSEKLIKYNYHEKYFIQKVRNSGLVLGTYSYPFIRVKSIKHCPSSFNWKKKKIMVGKRNLPPRNLKPPSLPSREIKSKTTN